MEPVRGTHMIAEELLVELVLEYPKVINGRVALVTIVRDVKTGEKWKRIETEDGDVSVTLISDADLLPQTQTVH